MGDRTWVNIQFMEKDLEKFNKVLINEIWGDDKVWWDDVEISDGIVFAQLWDANYGWYEQIETLANAGLTFDGGSGPGDNYSPEAFASYKGNYMSVITDYDGFPTVRVEDDGNISQSGLKNVRDYLDTLKLVQVEFGC